MWDTVKTLLGSAAPMVGGLLAGQAGSAVGTLIASALGVENTPQAIATELQNNPDALLKIKQLESDERVALRELSLKETALSLDKHKANLADTANARFEHKDSDMPSFLTIILALMVTGMFAALFFATPPAGYAQVLIMIAGAVMGAFGTAVAFWMGAGPEPKKNKTTLSIKR
jgi:hypothetical protein